MGIKAKAVKKEEENKPTKKNINDSAEVNTEIEYFKKEISELKNKMVNMEHDIADLKIYNKKLGDSIGGAKSNNVISSDKKSDLNEEIKLKLKTLDGKKI